MAFPRSRFGLMTLEFCVSVKDNEWWTTCGATNSLSDDIIGNYLHFTIYLEFILCFLLNHPSSHHSFCFDFIFDNYVNCCPLCLLCSLVVVKVFNNRIVIIVIAASHLFQIVIIVVAFLPCYCFYEWNLLLIDGIFRTKCFQIFYQYNSILVILLSTLLRRPPTLLLISFEFFVDIYFWYDILLIFV